MIGKQQKCMLLPCTIERINVGNICLSQFYSVQCIADLTTIYLVHQPWTSLSYELFWWFVIRWGPRINSALLPRRQLCATLVICINPRRPLRPIWKITFGPITLEWYIRRLLLSIWVCRIHFWWTIMQNPFLVNYYRFRKCQID